MFLQASAILLTEGSASVHAGIPPSSPPQEQTPPGSPPPPPPREQRMLGYGQHAGGMHPTGMQSCIGDAMVAH